MTLDKQGIGSFKTLWLRYDAHSVNKHQLFLKEHSVRKQDPELPKGHTLFLLNVPPYATADSLKHAFTEACGAVRTVTFTTSPGKPKTGFKAAYIVFQRESSLDKALALPKTHCLTLQTESHSVCPTGLSKWCKEYNSSIFDEKLLKKEIEEYMNNYDKQVAERLEREKAQEGEQDEDGWVTVSGRKKRGQQALSRKESTISKVQQKQEERIKKKQLLNFYTFQIRESKKQNLAELRKKFELDKSKLQQLKLRRTFKPF
ncbi:ribosomal RNA-processing protein 7 homolog A [Cephus cinctus]|uniref:Ribosomal RNA-processing protein 7 homolog A n=1 Tax=Cephus cinctus TaxID=211228 RepID=A0AAJ7FE71_CEPCN|nr:ribosomal RNA-processing protein 7 homolog A [Cephus cinctus]